MKRLSVLLAAIALNIALAKSLRLKRQSNDEQDEEVLDNKYGYDGPSWDRPPRPSLDDQRWSWPDRSTPRPRPTQRPRPIQRPWPTLRPTLATTTTTTRISTANPNGSTTLSSDIQNCIRNCPVTPEYNPVCGTNMVQYNNAGRLDCARSCGVNVSLLRASRCPATTAAPNS